jgi:transcriptional regulator with XRE-family HTH domain
VRVRGKYLHDAGTLSVGERIAWYRQRCGMSQEVLAGLVGRTADWLSKIENNRIDLDRLSVLHSLASALDVMIGDLIGEPLLLDWSAESGRSTVPALRAALMDYRQITPLLTGAPTGPPPELDALALDVSQVWDAYQDPATAIWPVDFLRCWPRRNPRLHR